MLVVVAGVRVMPVTVVLKVDVVVVADRRVATALAVLMPGVRFVHHVERTGVTFVPMALVLKMRVTLVHIVHVAGVLGRGVLARRRVRVLVL
jgi:hypothetical protein